jgi:hypothetical protein
MSEKWKENAPMLKEDFGMIVDSIVERNDKEALTRLINMLYYHVCSEVGRDVIGFYLPTGMGEAMKKILEARSI